MKTLPLIACLLVYSSAQAADNGLSKCSEVKSDIERLQCFDDLVKVRGALSPVATTASKGAWTLQTETSKINDSQNVTLAVKSSSTISGKFGGSGNAELQILCREGKTDAYFTFAGHFLADIEGYGELTVRIDKKACSKNLTFRVN